MTSLYLDRTIFNIPKCATTITSGIPKQTCIPTIILITDWIRYFMAWNWHVIYVIKELIFKLKIKDTKLTLNGRDTLLMFICCQPQAASSSIITYNGRYIVADLWIGTMGSVWLCLGGIGMLHTLFGINTQRTCLIDLLVGLNIFLDNWSNGFRSLSYEWY